MAIGGLVIVVSGSNFIYGVTRLNSDGTMDTGFTSGIPTPTTLRAIDIQSDGKIIVAGHSSNIWRLNTNGTIDNSFNATTSGTGTTGAFVWVTKIQSDGKILVGGAFESVNGVTSQGVARLNTDGTIDNTFSVGLGATGGRVIDIAIQTDGKIIIVGDFTKYDGVNRYKIARLNTDGSLDTSFDPGTQGGSFSPIEEVLIQPDRKIVITGDGGIKRINEDGTVDSDFNVGGSGFSNHSQYTVALQNDGKILVGGNSTQFNGNTVPRLVRLNTDGSLDNTFNVAGTGPDARVWTITIQDDGKILIGGEFSDYNGTTSRRFSRLNGDGGTTSVENIKDNFSFNIYPNPANDFVTITNIPVGSTVNVTDIIGKTVYSSVINNEQTTISTANFVNGVYIIQITNNGAVANRKLVVSK